MLPSDGLHPRTESGRAYCGGDQRESGEGSGGRMFPAGPVSPPEGVRHQDTAAAGVPGRHTAPCGVFPGACQRGTGTAYGRIRQGGGKGTHEADVGRKCEGAETDGAFRRPADGRKADRSRQAGSGKYGTGRQLPAAERRE